MDVKRKIHLDLANEQFWRDGEPILLRPKTWAVLRSLVTQPGQLLTKNELLDAVWPGVAVTEGTLNKSIGELRTALGDDKAAPRFIETIPRRGFRWIGAKNISVGAAEGDRVAISPVPTPASRIVARATELHQLDAAFARAAEGTRQVVFVTAEAGGGKTTLVDEFVERLRANRSGAPIAFAFGSCIDAFGEHEPYLPLIEAIERLGRSEHAATLTEAVRRYAPNWLPQLPGLAGPLPVPADIPRSGPSLLRELVTALDAAAAEIPLILIIEDAHWSDVATVDACNLLARRRDRAHLLVILTMRPADALIRDHPILGIKSELVAKQLAQEIHLPPFPLDAVHSYLSEHAPHAVEREGLAEWIHHQTGGNPFFVRNVVDEFRARELSDGDDHDEGSRERSEWKRLIPDNLRELLDRRLSRLPTEQLSVLEAASTLMTSDVGIDDVAAAAGLPTDTAEEICYELARPGELLTVHSDESDGGGQATTFRFLHGLVQSIVYGRVSRTRRRQMHLRVAERLEQMAGDRPSSIAPQLGFHFERGGDHGRAVKYHQIAADAAFRHGAARDAVAIRTRVLELLEQQPENGTERTTAMLRLAQVRQAAHGFGDPQVESLFRKALDTAEAQQDMVSQFNAAIGLHTCLNIVARYSEAEAMSRKILAMADAAGMPPLKQVALFLAGSTLYRMGRFRDAIEHLDASLTLDSLPAALTGFDAKATATAVGASVSAHVGRTARARSLAATAVEIAAASGPYNQCAVATMVTVTFALLGDIPATDHHSERALALATQHGFEGWVPAIQFFRGWLLCRSDRLGDGIALMRDAYDKEFASDRGIDHSLLCILLADEMAAHDPQGAAGIVADGFEFVRKTGEGYCEADLYRLRGLVRHAQGAAWSTVEGDLAQALSLARARETRWTELRTASTFAELAPDECRREAYSALESALTHFTDGGDLPMVKKATALATNLT